MFHEHAFLLSYIHHAKIDIDAIRVRRRKQHIPVARDVPEFRPAFRSDIAYACRISGAKS